jgi:hypothetical protein
MEHPGRFGVRGGDDRRLGAPAFWLAARAGAPCHHRCYGGGRVCLGSHRRHAAAAGMGRLLGRDFHIFPLVMPSFLDYFQKKPGFFEKSNCIFQKKGYNEKE